MTANEHLRTIIGDLMIKMAVLLEAQDTLTAKVAELETKLSSKPRLRRQAHRGD